MSPSGGLGGAERSLLGCVLSLRRAEPSWSLRVLSFSEGALVERFAEAGVHVEVLPLPEVVGQIGEAGARQALRPRALAASARFAARLRRTLAAHRPDVVHTNGVKAHLLAPAVAPLRRRVVWHVRDFVGERRVARTGLGALRRSAAGAIANSHAVARDLSAVAPGLPTRTVHNAIDLHRFRPGPPDPALVPPGAEGAVRVGLVSTFARWKGHALFLDAAARLKERFGPEALRFVIVGGPIYATAGSQWSREELAAEVRARGLEAYVHFAGFVDAPERAYRSLDVVVHASTRPEPFGRVIVEAMACARPVVVSAEGGASELFEHGVQALGFTPRDPRSLADAIASLAEDPERRQALAEAGRRHAHARFGDARLGPELVDAYAAFGLAAPPAALRGATPRA
ncbi:MAG: glycosyltransferase family 4 protein [Myxococcota bacterium]